MQIIKVFDVGCPICKEMGKFDRSLIQSLAETAKFEERALSSIMEQNNAESQLLYQILERYAVNPDYTLDLPVYVVSNAPKKYVGHIQGEKTESEFSDELLTILKEA